MSAIKTPQPLGLPAGSIRALLALTIVVVVNYQLLIDIPVSASLSEALMIILAHYFAARRNTVQLPADIQFVAQVKSPPQTNPLWLPRGSVRILIVGMFLLTIMVLLLEGRIWQAQTIGTLGLIMAYLAGVLLSWLWQGGADKLAKPCRWCWWLHIKALLVLLACVMILVLTLAGGIPHVLELGLLAFILFYFGSR